jgi:hypothetical protein
MRKDMKDLLVNTGRHGAGGKAAASRRARFKTADPDQLPLRLSTSRHRQFGWDCKELGDRLRPLYKFLEANCGRPWDAVYSEIIKVGDHRSIRGYHLLQHVWNYVVPNNFDVGHRRSYGPFFVDADGTLQKEKPHVWPRRPSKDNPRLVEGADRYWEKIEGYWYEFTTVHWTTPTSMEDLAMINGEVSIIRIALRDETHEKTTKHQVNSKTQKKLDAMYVKKKAA